MMWSKLRKYALGAAMVAAMSCGSSGYSGEGSSDSLTLSFLGFTGVGIEQQDIVLNTSADVDVCATVCSVTIDEITGVVTVEIEDFTSTNAMAQFVNYGYSDILIDHYTLVLEGANVPQRTVQTAFIIPGGRCSGSADRRCSVDSDCQTLGPCSHEQTDVQVLLFDFEIKTLLATICTPGQTCRCPTLDPNTGFTIPGNVLPQLYQAKITFFASDATGERFQIKTGFMGNFFDANNCTGEGV